MPAKTWLSTADVADRAQRGLTAVRLAAGKDLHGHQAMRDGQVLPKSKWVFHAAAVDAWIRNLDMRAQIAACGCATATGISRRPRGVT